MSSEKRSRQRKPINTAVQVKETDCYHDAVTAEVSESGLSLFIGKEDVQPGEIYQLTFDLPVRGQFRKVSGEAKVIHQCPHGSYGYKVGLQFVGLDTLTVWTIEAFVKSSGALPSSYSPSYWTSVGVQAKRGHAGN